MKRKEEKPGKREKLVPIKKRSRWHSLAELQKALRESGGYVTHAAKLAGMSYNALALRIKQNPELQAALDEALEEKLDYAENQLQKLIKAEELGAICFFLKTKGKKRGFVERVEQEHSGPGGSPLVLNIQVPDKETKALVEKAGRGEGL